MTPSLSSEAKIIWTSGKKLRKNINIKINHETFYIYNMNIYKAPQRIRLCGNM